ncbi:MAG: 16S rRNA (guanine(527)-N(7))-methyltransferase RsmG [Alphaproteobacteria bacterium]|jgi:16S rRNA (guanine527-N7)-methyltransferase|nr:16S rRNA (guanine(527)-N(7))-methyltransferase RsmG [Alphaproteobacteria bacterium]
MKNLSDLEKNVSCETLKKLKKYEALLKKWQKAINLVSKNTIENAWERHILDSLQLIGYLPKDKDVSIVDLGSGGGFPPLVLAIAGYTNVSAIESDERKCLFMAEVAKQTETKINIINKRIEKVNNLKADIVTSRALAKIDLLLNLSKNITKKETKCLFLKGKTAEEEIKKAQEEFDFQAQTFKSMTSNEAKVVKIERLKEKK